ncbi:P-loop containing nucleoside triphosphate hydrolase protein [Cantharellus anzutake]|uniref:P-loop containing nucleoside triphosphate hydrolase protein n=1 Tax=Cantharellus anzutake TaxID=1750568 RepID=UPI00190306F7|nr:P-loop containing nucleoside triphosphate hydrolase protein [Cantharellus anzutake]KAF8336966.1 P-loop containing nucleoside triphosphate hydrolase protein [Cantharellus anzutake]
MPTKRRKDSDANPSHNLRPEFSLKSLSAPGGIEAAIGTLVLGQENDGLQIRWDVEMLSRELTRAPDVLVILLSSNRDMRSFFSRWILDQFPSDPGTFSTSCHRSVLEALVNVTGKITPPRDIDQSLFKEHLRTVPLVTQALQSMKAMRFDDDYEPYTPVIPEPNTRKRQKTRGKKRGSVHVTQTDVKALEVLQVEIPTSQEEWTFLSRDFLNSQRNSLQFLIDILGKKSVQSIIFEFVLRVVQAPVELARPRRRSEAVVPAPESTAEEFQSDRMKYPTISPDKARYSFEWPAEFGEWNIYISSTAIKHLRQFRRADKSTFKIIQEKIIKLSEGLFSGSNQKRLEGAPNDVPIYEAKMTGDLRLVYQIDIAVDYERKVDKQIIRIYGIYTHAQFDHRLWSRVAQTIQKVDGAYRNMINYRVQPRQVGVGANNMTPPHVWPHSDGNFKSTITRAESASALSEDQCLELHKILSLEKFIPYSAAVLNTILQDIDAVHPFFVSQAEMKIIQHPSSCFVIGRSGTGKTTTMVFKLLSFEEARRQSGFLGGSGRIHQVFLTQSHVLASKVEEYYLQLLEATQIGSALVPGNKRVKSSEKHLTELDEEADDRPDLPDRFSELQDEHFPLFLTYDQLRRMLEAEYDIAWHRGASQKTKAPATTPHVKKQKNLTDLIANDTRDSSDSSPDTRRGHSGLVTFEAFKAHYWSHMDQRQIKGLDPAQVLSEIMGVIRGHKDTMKTDDGYLTREAYIALSHRSHSAFASDRGRIYDIFEKYHKLKIANNAFDSADRTHKLLRKLNSELLNNAPDGTDGTHNSLCKVDPKVANIDFLYIDEVQDLLIIDTKMLRDLCPNPHGHFWGGDTAQTISVGSSFRFEDLKALVYLEELNNPLVKEGARQAVKSEVFELLVNYRSHGGIVECAASIIDLLSSMFPYSIDKLQREASIVAGPKPRVFREKLVHWEQFLCGSGDTRLDFGARQVIIVRNDEARDEVRAALGNEGLVLTLLESKGLEFDDVLLYNFFGSSPASPAQWRVIQSKNADPVKHRVIESELKRLYVAITRARHHIWLWDSSDIAEPMLNHWISQNLVRIHDPSEPFPQLATTSTIDEWYSTGRTLFPRSLFAQAASCFEKAQRPDSRDIALAYQRRKDARSLPLGEQRLVAFKVAGSAFEACAQLPSAGVPTLRRRAGECFAEGGDFASAGVNFEAAGNITDAALNYHKAQRLDDAARLVRPPDGTSSLVEEPTRGKILDSVKLQFLRRSELERASPLFDNADEEVEFVNDYLHERSDLVVAIYKQKGSI